MRAIVTKQRGQRGGWQMIEDEDGFEDIELTAEELAREKRLHKEMEPFREHQEICEKGCQFFPITMACYEGAKLMNPNLSDASEKEYIERIKRTHKDCEWCNE